MILEVLYSVFIACYCKIENVYYYKNERRVHGQATIIMPTKTKKLYPGSGAKANILTRFIHPKVVAVVDPNHRTAITLLNIEEKQVNKRQQECFVFQCLNGPAYNLICYSVKNHIIISSKNYVICSSSDVLRRKQYGTVFRIRTMV